MKVFRSTFYALASTVAALSVAWAFGALYLDFPKAGAFPAILFVLAVLTAPILGRGKLLKLGIIFAACALVASWWLTLKPSNDRPWQSDVLDSVVRDQWR